MRFTARLILAAVFTALVVSSATAQDRRPQGRQPGGFGGGFGVMNVYTLVQTNPALHEELKISDEQKEALTAALAPVAEKRRELFGAGFGRGGQPGQRPTEEAMREMREKMETLNAETKKAVEGALKPEQVKRLKQINVQVMGLRAFSDKDIQTELKLTDDQKDQIKSIMDEFQTDARELGGRGFQRGQNVDREEIARRMQENQRKMEALTKETMEKVDAKLTDAQKSTWKEMQGEKFDTAKLRPAPRQRRDD